jgi:hypothetical protein
MEEGRLLRAKSKKKTRNRKFTMSDSEVMTILIPFHQSHYRYLKAFYINYIKQERTPDSPKTVSYRRFVELLQIEHTRQRSFNNFINNMIAAVIAYNFLPRKTALNLRIIDLMKSTMIA